MKKIVILLLLLAGGAAGGYAYWRFGLRESNVSAEFFTLYGNVEIRRVNLGFRVPGRIETLLFEEGDTMKKGDVIATLDRQPYAHTAAMATAQVARAQATYDQYLAGNRPQEIAQSRATLDERAASLQLLESDFKRVAKLVKTAAVSQEDYETVIARRDEAAAREALAKATLELLEEGYRKEEIAVAKAALAEAEASLKKAETDLADTVLMCPNDGVLLTRVEEPGAVVQAGQAVATLSLTRSVWVYVYVAQTQLGLVAPGMKAEIYTDTAPQKPYSAHVGYISPQAEFTPKTVETTEQRTNLVYRVRVIADAPDDGLRQGMPVTVRLYFKDETRHD